MTHYLSCIAYLLFVVRAQIEETSYLASWFLEVNQSLCLNKSKENELNSKQGACILWSQLACRLFPNTQRCLT